MRTSIKDLAKAAGVSITTVSRALNGYNDVSKQTKEKIEKLAKELNYAPDYNARSLGGKSGTTIALLLSGLKKTDEGGFTFGIISGIYQAALESHADFMLLTTNASMQNELNYLQLCRQKNIDGVVVMGIRTDDPYYDEIVQSEIPCAMIDIPARGKNVVSVSIDNVEAASKAVNSLLEKGHHKIGMINGSTTAAVSKDRLAGYSLALLDYHMDLNLDYIKYTDFDEQSSFEKSMELLLEQPDITALFCASDLIAIGSLRAAQALQKRVPQDLSIIGFDDMPTAKYISGGLSTVRQDPFNMGKVAGQAVAAMIRKEKTPSHITVPFKFIERNTTSGLE